jgi:uncharacterized protein
MINYNTYNNYLKKRFGKSVLKIPLNAGFTCPNIDGTKSKGGCIYCDNVAFSPVAASTDPVITQLEKGITRGKHRFALFIGYFQAYSNTFASVEKLKENYEPVIGFPDVVGIAIGTRPDCFSKDILDYLSEINERTYLSVEIGMQTTHNSTLKIINRHHSFEDSEKVFHDLSKRNIESVVHVMLGLPGETREMMMKTAEIVARLPVQGVKIHQLMIIKNTLLESKWYLNNKMHALSLEGYAELVGEFISRLRSDQIIHRLMADSRIESGLVAPLWSANKRNSLQFIQNYLKQGKIFQGKKFEF